MLSLILSNRSNDLDVKTTLIISPLSTLSQWSSEISSKTTGLKQLTYHGSHKPSLKELQSYDIVLTTYGTLSAEFKTTQTKEGEVKYILGNLLKNNWYRVVLDGT